MMNANPFTHNESCNSYYCDFVVCLTLILSSYKLVFVFSKVNYFLLSKYETLLLDTQYMGMHYAGVEVVASGSSSNQFHSNFKPVSSYHQLIQQTNYSVI